MVMDGNGDGRREGPDEEHEFELDFKFILGSPRAHHATEDFFLNRAAFLPPHTAMANGKGRRKAKRGTAIRKSNDGPPPPSSPQPPRLALTLI